MPKVLNIAHRGARSLAPENTLAAARKAFELGADMWELDVGLTADGVPILVHDSTLERTSNVAEIFPERAPWRLHEFTMAEYRKIDFGGWFNEQDPFGQIRAGAVSRHDQESYVGEPAPTLEEALRFTRQHGWRVNVEIKDMTGTAGDATIVEKVVALIEESKMRGQVLLSSFNHDYLRRARTLAPHLALGALVEERVDDPAALLRQLDAQFYNPHLGVISLEEIAPLRAQGVDVNVWTVNDEALMRRLMEAGVSGLFTDFPQRLLALQG
ncbi:MAG: glycerophosphodiester phosphodiesterase [Ardenticatenales bacterium]|nr:glycerophosphodiester phosphodiesterase [Ardenticatenales bacterium]